ncbi:MAG: nucleotidyl transferase AbiEii/AbiGii toxin family protein [Chloroflexi bacterium]|nr:nucleotidyl transferase AbiEii/AbiGii toxin family protein [Chloroflexota bacterium]
MRRDLTRAQLIELAHQYRVDPVYLEKDLVLTEIIRHYAQGPLADVLVLKGGQALRHVYGSARLSKDIDYVARRRMEFEVVREATAIDWPRISFPDRPEGRTKFGFRVRPIRYRGPLGFNDTVELEVSFRGDLVRDPQPGTYVSEFCEPFGLLVMDFNEMVAEKIRALYQRGNSRDLYDLWFMLGRPGLPLDPDMVRDILPHKFRPPLVAKGWNRGVLYDRIREAEALWDATLGPLLPDRPSFDEALTVVERGLRFLPR